MTAQQQAWSAGAVTPREQGPPPSARIPVVGAELVNPVSGSRTVFRATAASTGGAYVEVEQTYRPRSPRPPLHLHPNQDEHFTVLRGRLRAVVDGVQSELHSGDELVVPRGVPHRMWADAEEPTVTLWRTSPALRTDQLYCDLWAAAEQVDFQPDPLRAYQVTLAYGEEFQLC
jgi:mannose-6-phosphate isomerase-like protein (cupin superfamily)